MKTLLNTLFFLLLITQICFAQPVSPSANQSGWFWQNPLPCGNTLNDVCLVNENVATAVGEAGTIIRTTDGGETWSIQSSGTTLTLNSVCFVDADEGWVAGGDAPWMEDVSSIILHTTNGGKIWTTQNSGTNMPLNDVCFIDADIGTAVGGYYNGDNNDGIILGTTDGGENWGIQFSDAGPQYYLFTAVSLVDASTRIVAGVNGRIFKTTNSGNSWISIELPYGPFNGLSFANLNIGTVVGSNWNGSTNEIIILRTTNSGDNWARQLPGISGELNDVCLMDINKGVAVGYEYHSGGAIFRTTNGGTNWIKQSIGNEYGPALRAVCFADTNTGMAVGDWGIILRTTDGGKSWVNKLKGFTDFLSDIYFTDSNTGWAVGWNSILKTQDGGKNWINQFGDSTYIWLEDVCFSDANTGWVVGSEGKIFNTTDGGNNWTTQTSGISTLLSSIYFISSATGWVVGDRGIILYTSDAGKNWTSQISGTTASLSSVFAHSSTTAWVVSGEICGDIHEILKTTDGGSNWAILSVDSTASLFSVYFISSTTGWAVGSGGTILSTTDAGNTWSAQASGTTHSLSSVFFTSSTTGWAVGSGGTILFTSNGGQSWIEQPSGTKNTLNAIHFTSSTNGWAVGNNGTILTTTNGGVTFISDEQITEVPKDFVLYQNYPNPFNPSTKISWQSPVSSRQTLKVYDVLGNEVATLVDKEMEAGYRSVDFNASNLSSGVYFYKIQAGNFIETKKMILLR